MGGDWTKHFISKILHITHSQWIYRNFALHDKQKDTFVDGRKVISYTYRRSITSLNCGQKKWHQRAGFSLNSISIDFSTPPSNNNNIGLLP